MKLTQKSKNSHRGVIGVESAIVMIAFVIVAAALAFVVLNMGFSTTQKAKTAITASLDEASSSIEVAGKVTGHGNVTQATIEIVAVPLKIAAGSGAVNLDDASVAVKYLSNTITYDNIYGANCSLSNRLNKEIEGGRVLYR